jgi:ABC-type polysaccharide/polyol phosphate export permease
MAVGLKSGDRFDIIMGALDAFIVRLSTALYPQAFMPGPIAAMSTFNPLTYATDLFRWSLNFDVRFLANPVVALLVLVIFLMTFNFAGVMIYERRLEGGTWR